MSVINVKVKYIRPEYNNLQEWMNDMNNEYIGRRGIIFINKERFPKRDNVFANPFKISKTISREEVIDKYKQYIEQRLENEPLLVKELLKLKNKTLGCWCAPEQCHGHVLLELIEKYDELS
jgi:hypothetical protein